MKTYVCQRDSCSCGDLGIKQFTTAFQVLMDFLHVWDT